MRFLQYESQLVGLVPQDSHELFMLAHVADAYLELEHTDVRTQTTTALTEYVERRAEPSDVHFDSDTAKLLLLGLERVITAGQDDYRIQAAKHMLRGAEIEQDELEPRRIGRSRTATAPPVASDTLAPVVSLSDWRRKRLLPSATIVRSQQRR